MRTALIVAALALAACSSTSTAPDTTGGAAAAPAQTSEPASRSTAPVIATIATHDQRVTILGGAQPGQPLRVVLRNADGAILADDITVDELERRDPLLGALVTSAVASNAASPTYLWGGM